MPNFAECCLVQLTVFLTRGEPDCIHYKPILHTDNMRKVRDSLQPTFRITMRSGPLFLGCLLTSDTTPCCCFFVVGIAAQYDLRPNRSDGTHRFFARKLTDISDSQVSAFPESGHSICRKLSILTGRFRPLADIGTDLFQCVGQSPGPIP